MRKLLFEVVFHTTFSTSSKIVVRMFSFTVDNRNGFFHFSASLLSFLFSLTKENLSNACSVNYLPSFFFYLSSSFYILMETFMSAKKISVRDSHEFSVDSYKIRGRSDKLKKKRDSSFVPSSLLFLVPPLYFLGVPFLLATEPLFRSY